MKLTNKRLGASLDNQIAGMGYQKFEDSLTGSNGLYVKPIGNEYFLTLGLTISRVYESKFTASYYLSKVTRWGSVWGDMPPESFKRIGHFLSSEERVLLLDQEYSKPGVVDSWWDPYIESHIEGFVTTLQLTENRFLEQEGLLMKIQESLEIQELSNCAASVIGVVTTNKINQSHGFKYLPNRTVDNVPMDWFKAAEIILFNQQRILNLNTVKLLATDAWRQFKIRSKS